VAVGAVVVDSVAVLGVLGVVVAAAAEPEAIIRSRYKITITFWTISLRLLMPFHHLNGIVIFLQRLNKKMG
jgi:hypothetical protein